MEEKTHIDILMAVAHLQTTLDEHRNDLIEVKEEVKKNGKDVYELKTEFKTGKMTAKLFVWIGAAASVFVGLYLGLQRIFSG